MAKIRRIAAILLLAGLLLGMVSCKPSKPEIISVMYREWTGFSIIAGESSGKYFIELDEGNGKEPVRKDVSEDCMKSLREIIEGADLASWIELPQKDGEINEQAVEVGYSNVTKLVVSTEQELPEEAEGFIRDIETCLMEYSGFVK